MKSRNRYKSDLRVCKFDKKLQISHARAYHFFLFRLVNFESYQKINNENQIFLIARNTFFYQGGSNLQHRRD